METRQSGAGGIGLYKCEWNWKKEAIGTKAQGWGVDGDSRRRRGRSKRRTGAHTLLNEFSWEWAMDDGGSGAIAMAWMDANAIGWMDGWDSAVLILAPSSSRPFPPSFRYTQIWSEGKKKGMDIGGQQWNGIDGRTEGNSNKSRAAGWQRIKSGGEKCDRNELLRR